VEQQLRACIAAAGLPVTELLLLAEPDPHWGQRLVALFRLDEAASDATAGASSWPARLQALARGLPPAQRPGAWLHCPDLAPSAMGKWQRSRWQSRLAVARSEAPPPPS